MYFFFQYCLPCFFPLNILTFVESRMRSILLVLCCVAVAHCLLPYQQFQDIVGGTKETVFSLFPLYLLPSLSPPLFLPPIISLLTSHLMYYFLALKTHHKQTSNKFFLFLFLFIYIHKIVQHYLHRLHSGNRCSKRTCLC